MCQFNVLIVKRPCTDKRLETAIRNSNLNYRLTQIDSLIKQLDESYTTVLATKSDCDCGSVIGIDSRLIVEEGSLEAEIRRLRRKGCSVAKIERYRESKRRSFANRERRFRAKEAAEEKNWITILKELAQKGIGVGILFHEFGGLIETEDILIKSEKELSLAEIQSGGLRKVEEDIVYWVTGDR